VYDPLTRFGILGDVHCEDERLGVALAELRSRSVDAILAVGDIVDGYGDVERTIALLIEDGVVAVRGNHERWFVKSEMRNSADATTALSETAALWIEGLPATREIETVRGTLLLCHGVGDDDMMMLRPDARGYGLQTALDPIRERDDLALVIGGHTHRRMVRSLPTGPTFINPGTLHRQWEAGFGLVDLDAGRVLFWDFVGASARASEEIEL